MLRSQLPFLALAALAAVALARFEPKSTAGPLLIVGGGGTPPEVLRRAMELVHEHPDVAVLPYASAREDRGVGSVAMWLAAGAATAQNLDSLDDAAAAQALASSEIIWMPGGSQAVLMEALRNKRLVEPLRSAWKRGALVGGTSAGAAVLSSVMIERSADSDALVQDSTPTAAGLGLFEGAIVDQHFVRRKRNVRLLQTVLDNPRLVGFGIDERTALVSFPTGALEVWGESQVLVYDARAAEVRSRESDGRLSARGVVVDVLLAPDRYVLEPNR